MPPVSILHFTEFLEALRSITDMHNPDGLVIPVEGLYLRKRKRAQPLPLCRTVATPRCRQNPFATDIRQGTCSCA